MQMHQEVREKVLPSLDLAGVAEYIKSGRARQIVCLVGAGISVSAGIPGELPYKMNSILQGKYSCVVLDDMGRRTAVQAMWANLTQSRRSQCRVRSGLADFRSPGTGLYAQLEKYNLPDPQSLFEIEFFRRNPEPFHTLSKELFPGNFKCACSRVHCWVALQATWSLATEDRTLLRLLQANTGTLFHAAAAREGHAAPMLHSEHRLVGETGGAAVRRHRRSTRQF